jgi:hypothetical protein
MGWRAFLRSARAAERAAARNRQRRINAVHKGHQAVDRVLAQLDAQIERDLRKIGELEHKIREKPLTASGITYDATTASFSLRVLRNESGKLAWTAQPQIPRQPLRCSGPVDDAQRSYSLKAIAATRWAVFAAIEISRVEAGGKSTKLFTKSDPSKNRVFFCCGDKRYQAIQGELDVPLFGPEPVVALVAFPLPTGLAQKTNIDFMFESAPARVAVAFETPTVFQEAAQGRSLVEIVRTELMAQTQDVRRQGEEAKGNMQKPLASNSGCAAVIVAILGSVVAWGIL